MKTWKTCAQVQNFNNAATAYLVKPGNETKLCEPIRKLQKTIVKNVFDSFNEELGDIRRGNAAVHPETKVILREQNGISYAYTKEGEKKRDAELKALSEKLYEVESCAIQADHLPALEADEYFAFLGFVILQQEGGAL